MHAAASVVAGAERKLRPREDYEALVYHGPPKVSVLTVLDAKIEMLTDGVANLTTTNICGSDLHMYEGRTHVKKGKFKAHLARLRTYQISFLKHSTRTFRLNPKGDA